ncbi:hypothetical protein I546_6376 [Mycobacterium kansasii 732]|uniref:Uncharacterized protein n=1 Tax=Mycobacterium kansasii TaxID=1768 RepID=A0A1V3WVR2_MYCKA|nr:hypothetical protein I546_6376 [Mycobacterium kansasii 732]OOK70818.1 hypothetical protein BZL30_6690 [Mycobacterium kansasii]
MLATVVGARGGRPAWRRIVSLYLLKWLRKAIFPRICHGLTSTRAMPGEGML